MMVQHSTRYSLGLIILSYFISVPQTHSAEMPKKVVHISSVQCINHDNAYTRFHTCQLKAVNRTLKLFSARAELLKPPVTQSRLNLALYKKENGYKPFLVNFTMDMCAFLAGRKAELLSWIFDIVEIYSNINHTCPYTGEMIVQDLPLSTITFPLPIPDDEYRFDFNVYAHNKIRATIRIQALLSDYVVPKNKKH